MTHSSELKSRHATMLWLFIGAIFIVYGVIIFITGLIHYIEHAPFPTALDRLHPNMVWGTVLFIVGLLFTIFNWHVLRQNKDDERNQ